MSSFVAPKEEFDTHEEQSDNGFDAMDIDSDEGCDFYNSQSPITHSHFGLINGPYELHCPDIMQWSEYDGYQFSLILTLEGNRLWGTYDFGMFSGILNMARHFAASNHCIEFKWRGRENSEGEMSYGDHHKV
jgi:hypothetical protein